MLETIREYALERLDESGELDAARQQHAAYFGALAQDAETHLRTARQIKWLRRLDPEHDNLRAALTWSRASGDVETGLRIAGALGWYWVFRGYVGEGRDWLSELLGMPGGSSRSRARALLAAGLLANLQAEYATARSLGRQSTDLFAELGDRSGVGTALTCIGIADLGESNIAAARPVLEEAVAACREAGDRWGLAQALSQLASVFRQGGDLPAALTLREKAAAIARQRGDRWTLGMALMGAATIVRAQGDLSRSTTLYREALAVLRELEERWLAPRAVEGLAGCALLDGDHPRAARLFGAAAALREASGTREMSLWRVLFDSDIADLKAAMSDLAFTTTWAEGRAMTLEQAVAYALNEEPSA
jgi:tetratricopeptide (TPR) repeat protein